MFSVIFEVYPKSDQWDTYLGLAKMLRPELEQIDGFVDNIRYRSLTRDGWILSLSSWRDEKALVRWRTKQHHHETQEKGRLEVLADYQRTRRPLKFLKRGVRFRKRRDSAAFGWCATMECSTVVRRPNTTRKSNVQTHESWRDRLGSENGLQFWHSSDDVNGRVDCICKRLCDGWAVCCLCSGGRVRSNLRVDSREETNGDGNRCRQGRSPRDSGLRVSRDRPHLQTAML